MVDTKQLTEPDLFRSYWDDGLLDLLSGLAVLGIGVGWAAGLGPLAALQPPLWVLLWTPLRRRIVEPRAGYVRFARSRRRRSARELGLTLVLGLTVLSLAVLAAAIVRSGGVTPLLGSLDAGIPALLVALPAGLAGLLTGARRFYAYALVLVAAAGAAALFPLGPALPLAAAGLVVAGTGAALLTRFLRASRAYQEIT